MIKTLTKYDGIKREKPLSFLSFGIYMEIQMPDSIRKIYSNKE